MIEFSRIEAKLLQIPTVKIVGVAMTIANSRLKCELIENNKERLELVFILRIESVDGSLSVIEFQGVFKQTIETALGGKRLVWP